MNDVAFIPTLLSLKNQVVGVYTLERCIGEGGTGIVPSPTGDGEILFKVAEVFEPAGADASSVAEDAQKSFAAGMADDLLDELVAQLQTQYNVRIDQTAIQQAMAQ